MTQVINLKCKRCGHPWVRRKFDGLPARCPKCKSPYWNANRTEKWKRVIQNKKKAIESGEEVADKWKKLIKQ